MDPIICNNIRLTFLGEDILRVERRYRGEFCDENTFFVPDRASLGKSAPAYSLEDGVLCFGEYAVYLPAGDTLSGLRVEKNGKTVYRYRRKRNSGELPPPHKTPEVFALSDCPRILIPEGGYSASRKGKYRIFGQVEDVYLLFARKNGKALRRLYVALTGRCDLVRLSTFGGWNSKYYPYSDREARRLILEYERRGVPLDNMVIDTDWRVAENGMGYDVNTSLFPDLEGFFVFAHSHNVEIMFNDHPEPLHGAKVFSSREIAYRERHLQALLAKGLDTWWYDRNWRTHLISPTKDVRWETFGLYLFHDITEHFYRKVAGSDTVYRRPVVMGNVVDIANGVYRGIADSASHRYAIQWTGDIDSCAASLAQEVENLVRCSDNCIPYMNSDCGGHTGNPEKEQFIRWMQYGTLSPVFRPHCTNTVRRHREPWLYDEETLSIVREYVLMRYRLLPYLYANAYEAYETGIPMFRSLALEYPHDRRAAARRDEYLLGKNILIAPLCGVAAQPLGEKDYTAPVEVTFYNGREGKGAPLASAVWKTVHMDLRHEPPMPGVPVYNFSAKLKTKIKLGRACRLYVRNDDGATVLIDGKCVLEDKDTHSASLTTLLDLSPGEEHTVEIDYFQAEGEAFLGLYAAEVKEGDEREVYLPEGRWMDVFDGAVYSGKRIVRKRYALSAMPLFVRLGAILPLAESAQTTKAQSWARLTYDFYPSKTGSDSGYLYEDDGETTAYRRGAFSKCGYQTEYLPAENAYAVRLNAAEGSFRGDRMIERREITVKFHNVKGAGRVARVRINGEDVPFETHRKAQVFPFHTSERAADSPVVIVRFSAATDAPYEIKFYLQPHA